MYALRGIPISKGIAIGNVLIRQDVTKLIRTNTRLEENQIDNEVKRYDDAVDKVRKEIKGMKENTRTPLSRQNFQLLEFYSLLIEEDLFNKTVPDRIRDHYYTADNALVTELDKIKAEFEKLENEYFQSRFYDFKAVADRILRKLYGDIDLNALPEPIILASEELSVADVLHISKEKVLGIATESGSTTSHAAILAESLEIPAVFGIKDLLSYLKKSDRLIVDGYKGQVILNPDKAQSEDYTHIKKIYEQREEEITRSITLPSVTKDNVEMEVFANVSNTMDLNIARRHGAKGIGLFRTEMPFILGQKFLNEVEQFDLYKEYLLLFHEKEVVIRTLDLGGDKFFLGSDNGKDSNPFLGYRSIRIFLKEVDKFKQQLRAIIRASVFNDNVKIMIPMISSLDEVLKVKRIFKECEEEIKNEGRPFKYNIPLGIMVEIPSAAILSERLAQEVDFFSIGTNDLVQYTLAVDRDNPRVSAFYKPLNPAVLRLLELTVQNANKANIPVSVCGEIARNPLYVRLLMGMGIRRFSVNPAYIPLVKTIILRSTASDTKNLWEEIKQLSSTEKIELALKRDLKRNLFEIYESYFYDEKKDWKGLQL